MRFPLLAAIALGAAAPAFAQDTGAPPSLPSPEEVASGDIFTLGLGAAVIPDYEGSDDYRLIPGGAVRARFGGISVVSRGLYLYADLVPDRGKIGIDAGPIAGLRLNRTRKIKDDVVDLLPERETAVEVGGFAGVSIRGLTNPYDSLALRLDVVTDLARAHEGTIVTPNVEFSTPLSRTLYVGASLSADFTGDRFAEYYFSIDAEDALASGLPVFEADGGMKSWKLGLLANQSLTGDLLHGLSLFAIGSYSRLTGDFRRSPIVSERGSASQWFGGIGLAYTW